MLNQKNSKKQGDVGLGVAIGWFASQGATVCLPLTDSQDYDLVVDFGDGLKTVQVKTTTYRHKRWRYFTAQLAVKGGNRSGTGKTKTFDESCVDLLFILTAEGTRYFIPRDRVTARHSLSLGPKYDEFKV